MADLLRDRLQSSLGAAYTLERELGGGGMARVFVASDEALGRAVVVKVLAPELAEGVSAERFAREVRLAAMLQAPHIVPLLAAGVTADGLPYYTMPYVRGESLRARLAAGPVPLAEAIEILRDVARALAYAHRRGVVHRDVKPENVLLSEGTAVVTDFGIARALADARTEAPDAPDPHLPSGTLTRVGGTVGTPAYMAPEQAVGDTVDRRTDVYAWGVVAWELLAGAHPFAHRASGAAMTAAHLTEVPAPLRTRAPAVPRPVADVVADALAKDPAARPADADALLRAMDASPNARTLASRWRRPRAARLAALLGTGAALAAGLAVGGALTVRRGAADASGPARAVRAIAVVPFANVGGDTATAHLGGGMADELAAALARLPGLRVVPVHLPATPGRAPLNPRGAGRQLGVDAVLDGTLQRAAERLRVRVRLVRVSDGAVVWGEHYDRPARDLFALEDDVSAAIVAGLRGTLAGAAGALAAGAPTGVPRGTRDAAAYDLYLRGRYAWSKRGDRGLRDAIALFEQAVARDPRFARAHAGLAMAWVVLPVFTTAVPWDTALARAMGSADRALALDSSLADAHLARAYAHKMRWQWEAASREFAAAAALAPEDATVRHWDGVQRYATGDVDGAVEALSRARALDPFQATVGTDGALALYAARRLPEARAEIRRALALEPGKSDTWLVQGMILLAQGHPDSAAEAFRTAERHGTGFDMRPYLGAAARAWGDAARAGAEYAAVRRDAAAGRTSPFALAVAAANAGDHDVALAAVERLIATRDPLVTEMSLPCDPLFDGLKAEPRFARLLSAAGMRVCAPRSPAPAP